MKKSIGAIALAVFVTTVMVTGVLADDNKFKDAIAERLNNYQEIKSELRESKNTMDKKNSNVSEYQEAIQKIDMDEMQLKNGNGELIQL